MTKNGMSIFRRVSLLTLAVLCSGATAYFANRANIDKESIKDLSIDLEDAKSKVVTIVKGDEDFLSYKEGYLEDIRWKYETGVYNKDTYEAQVANSESDEFCLQYATNSDNVELQTMAIDVKILKEKKDIAETEELNDGLKATTVALGSAASLLAFVKAEENERKRKEDKENRRLKEEYERREAGYITDEANSAEIDLFFK